MSRVLCAIALFAMLAGQAFALNILFGGPIGNLTAPQLLQFPEGPYTSTCSTQCNTVNATISACEDDTCLCTNDVGSQLLACEQCMFTELVAKNLKPADPRIGSTPALGAYVSACKSSVNVTLAPLALVIPPDFDGPRDIILNLGETVLVVGFGTILGASFLFMFANLS